MHILSHYVMHGRKHIETTPKKKKKKPKSWKQFGIIKISRSCSQRNIITEHELGENTMTHVGTTQTRPLPPPFFFFLAISAFPTKNRNTLHDIIDK